MKKIAVLLIAGFVILTGMVSCIYKFNVEGVEGQNGVLVIEGDIVAGEISYFTLSYTKDISKISSPSVSTVAKRVKVESESGYIYEGKLISERDTLFSYSTRFMYEVDTRDIPTFYKARLVVEKSADSIYVSDWVSFTKTPPIDSVTYRIPEDRSALDIFVHTHSDDSDCKYFKWDYTEDWELHSYYWAYYQYDKGTDMIYELPSSENRYYCWNTDKSRDINVFSTEKLKTNVVADRKLVSIPRDSRKLQDLYSINVIQKSISYEEYKYWDVLLQNSENTGDLFSPQPSELRGNIHMQGNEDVPVVGYVGASDAATKRLFVDCSSKNLFKWELKTCYDTVMTNWALASGQGLDPFGYDNFFGVYLWAPRKCVDCRTAGTKNKPSFWPTTHE